MNENSQNERQERQKKGIAITKIGFPAEWHANTDASVVKGVCT